MARREAFGVCESVKVRYYGEKHRWKATCPTSLECFDSARSLNAGVYYLS